MTLPNGDKRIAELETMLNDFSPDVRAEALAELKTAAEQGIVDLEPETTVANMHCHTFFSFNAYGYSPSALVWLAKRRGYKLLGIVDFDVLDGVEEFLNACDMLGVRGSAGIETRVFVPELATKEINSPGEPGVLYHMGIGFTSSDVPESAQSILVDLRDRATRRNQGLIERINPHLSPLTLDYDEDVMPLAPGGTPTERHIALAYVTKAQHIDGDLATFWVGKLGVGSEDVSPLLPDSAGLQNLVRAKLMKRGGVGYVQPGPDTFPQTESLNALSIACGALPCVAWLDGLSEGEQAIGDVLELMINQGAVAFNIVPNRNWDIADPELKKVKVQNLYDVVKIAGELDLPLNIGTEMNSFGQKHIDDFDAPELKPVRQAFLDGAHFIYGHTVLQRTLSMGFQSDWAKSSLPTRKERNAFFTKIGYTVTPSEEKLKSITSEMEPNAILDMLGK